MEGNFYGLTNEQLVFLYCESKRTLDNYNNLFKQGMIAENIKTPFGNIAAIRLMTEAEMEELKNSILYQMAKSTVASLAPVVGFICEAEDMKHITQHFEAA